MEKKSITIYDIAREAQVSPATVSRILTGVTSVREEKRKRVMEVIEKHDFHPNAYARALTENRSRSISMIVAHSDNSYYSSVFAACESEAYLRGYVTFLTDTSSRPEKEVSALNRIRELRPEAVILCGLREAFLNIRSESVKALLRVSYIIIRYCQLADGVDQRERYKLIIEPQCFLLIGDIPEHGIVCDHFPGVFLDTHGRSSLYNNCCELCCACGMHPFPHAL